MLLTELELETFNRQKCNILCMIHCFFPERGIGIVAERTERTPITYLLRNTSVENSTCNLLGRILEKLSPDSNDVG